MTKLTDTECIGERFDQDLNTMKYMYVTLETDTRTIIGLHWQWQASEGGEWSYKIIEGEPELWQSN
jgi:hypothetical protein